MENLKRIYEFIMGPSEKPTFPIWIFIIGFVITLLLGVFVSMKASSISGIVTIILLLIGVLVNFYRVKKK